MSQEKSHITKDTKKEKEFSLGVEGDVRIDKVSNDLTICGDWDPYDGEDAVIIYSLESAKILKEALEDFIEQKEKNQK